MIVTIITILGSFASLFSLIFMVRVPGQPFSPVHWILLSIGIICFIIAVVWEIRKHMKSQPLVMHKDSDIKEYMYNWISRSGRVAIFSRDLSWVSDKIKKLLLSKAKQSELCICVPKMIPLVDELQKAGAEICSYPELSYIPSSRFTIINCDRADASVAVGGKKQNKHIIREFALGEHPFFAVANDLVHVLKKFENFKSSS